MSKAEKFIKDYTKKGSNEILSPYPQIDNDIRKIGGDPAKEFSPWLTPDQARKAVEIAREEIYEWLKENADIYTWYNEFEGESGMTNNFIDDLKKAIKDE